MKEAPPPGRSSTQARPPWSCANRPTNDRPIPVPGECEDTEGPWRNGSKIASRRCSSTPVPSSSTVSRAPWSWGSSRTQIVRSLAVCRAAFIARFSTMRSSFGGSTRSTTAPTSITTVRSASASRLSTARRVRAPTSAVRYCGSTMPRLSRSMSSRSFSRRSSLRAFDETRSCRSIRSSASMSGVRSSVIDNPRIEVSGLRSSCETAARNVFFISSRARSRSAASRSRCSDSRSACSASLRSVMSIRTPWR